MALYIPTTFGASGGGTIIASGSTSISGTVGMNDGWPFQQDYFVSNSITYSYWMWQGITSGRTNVTTFDILSGSTLNARLVAIGGGGGAGGSLGTWAGTIYAGNTCIGGGGAGGLVEFNNFPLIPGHYNIVAGAGGANGAQGIDSSITLPIAIAQPFTSSYVVAYSGGKGGTQGAKGTSGGSVGGNTQIPGNPNPIISNPVLGAGLGGRSGGDQGRTSGDIPQSTITAFNNTATGGGGFNASSRASSAGKYITDGGSGSLMQIYPYNYNTASYMVTGGGAAGLPGNPGNISQSFTFSQQGDNTWGIGSGGSVSGSGPTDIWGGGSGNYGMVYLEYPYYFNPYPKLATDGLMFRLSQTSLTGSFWYDLSGNGNDAVVSGNYMTSSISGWNFNGTNNYLTFPVSMSGYPVSRSFSIQWYGTKMNTGDVWYKESGSSILFRGDAYGGGRSNRSDWNNYQTGSNKTLYTLVYTDFAGASGNVGFSKLYINDSIFKAEIDPINGVNFLPTSTPNIPWQFGYSTNAATASVTFGYLSGSVSDLLLYNRPLDVSEIANNYKYLQTLPTVPTGSTNVATAPLPNGLTLYMATGSYSSSTGIWYDRSGNGNNGIVSGSALTGSTNGWKFNGTNNYVTFNPNLTAIPSSSFTLQWLTEMNTTQRNNVWSDGAIFPLPFDRWYVYTSASVMAFGSSYGPPYFDGTINTGYNGGKILFTLVATAGLYPKLYSGSAYVGTINREAVAFNVGSASYWFGTGSLAAGVKTYSGSVSSMLIYNRELSESEVNYNNVYLSSL